VINSKKKQKKWLMMLFWLIVLALTTPCFSQNMLSTSNDTTLPYYLTPERFPADNVPSRLDTLGLKPSTPSVYGKMTSRRWAHGVPYVRENLTPVKNPHPSPEPQPLREHPFDAEINGDGTKVYVGLQGNELLPGSEVAVYDVVQDKVIKRIPLKLPGDTGPPASSPFRLAIHPGGRFLFVTSRYSNFSSVIDTRTDEVVLEDPTDFYCMGMAFDQEGRTLYVTNRYLDQVFVIDIDTDGERFHAKMREPARLSDEVFFGKEGKEGIHNILVRRC